MRAGGWNWTPLCPLKHVSWPESPNLPVHSGLPSFLDRFGGVLFFEGTKLLGLFEGRSRNPPLSGSLFGGSRVFRGEIWKPAMPRKHIPHALGIKRKARGSHFDPLAAWEPQQEIGTLRAAIDGHQRIRKTKMCVESQHGTHLSVWVAETPIYPETNRISRVERR